VADDSLLGRPNIARKGYLSTAERKRSADDVGLLIRKP